LPGGWSIESLAEGHGAFQETTVAQKELTFLNAHEPIQSVALAGGIMAETGLVNF
jgi:hypothetical protein